MKITQYIELIRIIRKRWVPFFAIVLFVAISIMLSLGLQWCGKSIEQSANSYLDSSEMSDINITFSAGIQEKDIERFRSIPGVDTAEGYYEAYEFLDLNDQTHVVRITSVTKHVNQLTLKDGRLPDKADEIAVDYVWAKDNGVSVGDKIIFSKDKKSGSDEKLDLFVKAQFIKSNTDSLISDIAKAFEYSDTDGVQYLSSDEFTVTGLVKSPQYLGNAPDESGQTVPDLVPVTCVMFAPISAFDQSVYPGYTNVGIIFNSLRNYSRFSDEYQNESSELIKAIEAEAEKYKKEINAQIKEKKDRLKSTPFFGDFTDEPDSEQCAYFIASAADNLSVFSLQTICKVLDKQKYSLSLIFFIVSLLVSYCAISRLLSESEIDIGTKKALGFKNREIAKIYALYVFISTLLGALIGTILSGFAFEPLMVDSIKESYPFENDIFIFDALSAILIGALPIILQTVMTVLLCNRILKRSALSLLYGEKTYMAKHRFYEKLHLFRHFSLFTQTVINNFFANKKRVFMTFLCITSCIALIISALTIYRNILSSFDRQYEKIYDFDSIVYFRIGSEKIGEMEDILKEEGIVSLPVMFSNATVSMPDGRKTDFYLYVVGKDSANELIHILSPDGENRDVSEGVYCSFAYSKYYDIGENEPITFTDTDLDSTTVIPVGYFEHYLCGNVLLLDEDTYKNVFNKTFAPNTFFISAKGKNLSELSDKLSECDDFIYLRDDFSASKTLFDNFSEIFLIIVAVYIFSAVSMAFLVLFNQFTMFVFEKKKELTVMAINGYSQRKVKDYILLDTLFISFISLICGILFGSILSKLSIASFENESICFSSGAGIYPCVIGAVISMFLIFITVLLSTRKINSFDLTDINDR